MLSHQVEQDGLLLLYICKKRGRMGLLSTSMGVGFHVEAVCLKAYCKEEDNPTLGSVVWTTVFPCVPASPPWQKAQRGDLIDVVSSMFVNGVRGS